MKKKYRNSFEWTNIILKYIQDDNITATDKKYALQLLEDASNVVEKLKVKENLNEYENMWLQLNKYWLYLKTLKK